MTDTTKRKGLPPSANFLNAGLSGMAATCVVHPMDVLKNRIQMNVGRTSIPQLVASIYKHEGITKFYRGLTAGLVRQATYTTVRLGIFNQLQDYWRQTYGGKPNFGFLSLMATVAGGTGAFFGTPADVALVRMSSDGRLPPEQRRNYKNVIDAFARIWKEEGILTLWRGTVPTMGRAVVVNVSQLATYSQAKSMIVQNWNVREGIKLHFCASMLSGFLTTFNSMPFDVAKTRIQNLETSAGKPPGLIRMLFIIGRGEGIRALWKGFWPTYCRVGPHTVLMFIANEQLTKAYRIYVMKETAE